MDETILVVGAHPDDEVLGAGGTVAKHAAAGDEVHILIVTEGASEQYETGEAMVKQKREEAKRCADVLGVEAIHFGELPDMRLDDVPHVEVNAIVEDVVAEVQPSVVYTHSKAEVNRDHVAVYHSTMVATRPPADNRRVLSYEVPSSTDWVGGGERAFTPTSFVDVSDVLDVKVDAFLEYESEIRAAPHPRSEEMIRARARSRGAAAGFSAAEAFTLEKEYLPDVGQ